MKSYKYVAATVLCIFVSTLNFSASAQQQEPLDVTELAEKEADHLQSILDLEDWQVFYVDSTLKVNFVALQADLERLQKSKVTNTSIYTDVKDRCWDEIDATYKKIFTEEQWNAYLKSGAAKLQKQRAKRKAKASGKR